MSAARMKPKILIINPNTTASMTKSLQNMLAETKYAEKYDLVFTNPVNGPSSINNEEDAHESLPPCESMINDQGLLTSSDAFLVACYSVHPLVPYLEHDRAVQEGRKPVLGIFEASVFASLESMGKEGQYGIVSTGKVWETILADGVGQLSIKERNEAISQRFSGVETTGLMATELHDLSQDIVNEKVKEATKRLVRRGDVKAVCLGCAGMTGMDQTVREALKEELGGEGDHIKIIDGVLEGVRLLAAQLGE